MKLYSIAGAARAIGISRQRLGQLIRRGLLKGIDVIDVVGESGRPVYQVIEEKELTKLRTNRAKVAEKK